MSKQLHRKNTDNAKIVNRGDTFPQFVMSDESIDRYGDIVRASGWRLGKSSPIALVNHNPDFPCGQWVDVHVEGTRLLGRFKAAPRGTSQRVDEVLKMIDADILNSCSVGFLPITQKPRPGGVGVGVHVSGTGRNVHRGDPGECERHGSGIESNWH